MAKSFSKFIGIIIVIAILLSLGVSTLATDLGPVTYLGKAENTNSSSYIYGGTTANIIVIKQASTAFVAWVDETVPDAEIIAAVKAGDPSLNKMTGYVIRSISFNLGTVFGLESEPQYNVTVNIDTTNKIITTSKNISHFTFYSYYTPPITTEYGVLTVSKAVLGENAPDESFDITVAFTGDYASINNNGGLTGTDGSYTASLEHGESVSFSNIPMGVSYTVSEELSTAQTEAGWTAGEITSGTGTVSSTTPIAATVNNSYEAPPLTDYKSLEIMKRVSGDNASKTEEFLITVAFTGDYASIANNAGVSGTGGVYVLSLHDGESVIFSNIPMGVRYTVTENLSEAQTTAGWVAPEPAGGIINSTNRVNLTVENIYAEAEPQGEDEDIEDPDEDEDPVVDPEGETEDVEDPEAKLPQTGGIPKSAILGFIGLLFVLSGAVLSIVNRRKKHSKLEVREKNHI